MRVKQLTKNQLKILAMVCMTLDHIGAAFFPQAVWLRVIGRLAFPLFSYCIAEGCRYTRNKANTSAACSRAAQCALSRSCRSAASTATRSSR